MEKQTLFEAKVSELATAASKISQLEDSIARHLSRQQALEDEIEVRRLSRDAFIPSAAPRRGVQPHLGF